MEEENDLPADSLRELTQIDEQERGEESPTLPQSFQELAEPHSYQILRNEHVRKQNIQEMANFIEQVVAENPDVLVFLDKSARPAAWLFEDMWERLHPDLQRPEIKYVNLGREKGKDKGFNIRSRSTTERDINLYKKKVKGDRVAVRKLRENFAVGAMVDDPDELGGHRVEKTDQTYLDDKSVWLIDEFVETGRTLLTAQALFEEAFKNRTVGEIETHSLFATVPDWNFGRKNKALQERMYGIADQHSGSFRSQRVSPKHPDEAQLRQELSWAAQDYVAEHSKDAA